MDVGNPGSSNEEPPEAESDCPVDLSRFNLVKTDIFAKVNKGHPSFREPVDRSGHRMMCDRDYIYVIGGFSHSPGPQLFEEIWRFNFLCDKWEKVDINSEDFPHEMASFALCADAPSGSNFAYAYMFGGTMYPFGDEPSDRVHTLKRSPRGPFTWRQLATIGQAPIRQYGSSAIFHRGKMYLMGGTTGHVYNTEIRSLSRIERKNENLERRREPSDWRSHNSPNELWEWKLLEDGSNLTGRYRHESVIVGNDILIIGGGNTQWVAELDRIPAFDTVTNQLKTQITLPDDEHGYPEGRMCHACVQYEGKVYVLGGCTAMNPQTQSVQLFDDMWELDTFTWKWKKTNARLKKKLCFHSAAVTEDGCIYVFGGATNGRFASRCNLLQRVWLKPPSLQYFAQRAVLTAVPRMFQYMLSDLTMSEPHTLLRHAYGVFSGREDKLTFFDSVLLLKKKFFS